MEPLIIRNPSRKTQREINPSYDLSSIPPPPALNTLTLSSAIIYFISSPQSSKSSLMSRSLKMSLFLPVTVSYASLDWLLFQFSYQYYFLPGRHPYIPHIVFLPAEYDHIYNSSFNPYSPRWHLYFMVVGLCLLHLLLQPWIMAQVLVHSDVHKDQSIDKSMKHLAMWLRCNLS